MLKSVDDGWGLYEAGAHDVENEFQDIRKDLIGPARVSPEGYWGSTVMIVGGGCDTRKGEC